MYNGICAEVGGALICASQAPSQQRPLMKPPARSHSLRDSAVVTARWVLGAVSTSSCLHYWQVRAIHMPCPSAPSTMSHSRRSSPTISNDITCRGAGGQGVQRFAVADDDGIAERRWTRIIDEAACEGIVRAYIRLSTVHIARTFPCGVLKIDDVFHRMIIPSEAKKTNEVPLMHRWSTTIREPAQNLPISSGYWRPNRPACLFAWPARHAVSRPTCERLKRRRCVRGHYIVPHDRVQFGPRDALIENQGILVLVLHLNLYIKVRHSERYRTISHCVYNLHILVSQPWRRPSQRCPQ